MCDMVFKIPGKPIAKARPKFVRRGKFVVTYNPQETEEGRFMVHLIEQMKGGPHSILPFLNGPIEIDMLFCFQRPKHHYGTGKNARNLKPSAPQYHIIKPDIDNLIKFALDCMQDIVFKDDSQLFRARAHKKYSDSAETQIKLHHMGTTD